MYSIQVKDHFSAAHFLEDYHGLCGSVHGHRWEVVLTIYAEPDPETQMIIDFSHLKDALSAITTRFDHSFILDPDGNEASREFYALATRYGMRVMEFKGRTTAENIAKFIYNEMGRLFIMSKYSVTVYEAPNNSVTYSKED